MPIAISHLHLLQLTPQLFPLFFLLLFSLTFGFVVGREFVKQFPVHLHERFENVVDESDDGLIPMIFRYLVQRSEHDGHHDARVLFNHRHDVFVVPKIESALGHLRNRERQGKYGMNGLKCAREKMMGGGEAARARWQSRETKRSRRGRRECIVGKAREDIY